MHFMFCVSGFSGVGKDEFCKRLVEQHGAIHTGLIDPAKRHMMDVYGFSPYQMFGPSSARNAGDPRYPKTSFLQLKPKLATSEEFPTENFTKNNSTWWVFETSEKYGFEELSVSVSGCTTRKYFVEDTNPQYFLSPREALQEYGALMNTLHEPSWVRKGVEIHMRLAEASGGKLLFMYDRVRGVVPNDFADKAKEHTITCFSDFRHKHEFKYVRETEKSIGAFKSVMIRVKRPGIEAPPFQHLSETEQSDISDSEFDFIVNNDGDINKLCSSVNDIVANVKNMYGQK